MDSYPSRNQSKQVVLFLFLFSLYLSSLNLFISNPMNNDADAVHLIQLLFEFFFLTKCSEYWGHRRHSYPLFPQCVIIPVGEKYSGIKVLQTPGRTPTFGSPLRGTPVPRYGVLRVRSLGPPPFPREKESF